MSFLINGGIPEGDLPVKAPSGASNIRYVEGGKSYSSPMPDIVTATAQMQSAIDGIVADAEQQVYDLMNSLGYLPPVAFASGLNVDSSRFTVTYNGVTYAPVADAIPFTTTGTFNPVQWRVVQGDINLRPDLADPTGGGALVAFRQAGAGAASRSLLDKARETISVSDFVGSDAEAMQAAIDESVASGKPVLVDFPGANRTISSPVLMRPGVVSGKGAHHSEGYAVTVNTPIRAGYPWDDLADRPLGGSGGWWTKLRDISFRVGDPAKPILINTESHLQRIEGCSFRGNSDVGVPKVKLNATLYTQINGCDFGGSGDGIVSKESSWDVSYYGTNASWFRENNFNQPGIAAQLHGIFSFRDSTIESSASIAPKLVIGEAGKSAAAKTVVDHVYFECGTSSDVPTVQPLIKVESVSSPTITNCIFQVQNAGHPDADSTTIIDASGVNNGQFICNYNFFRPTTGNVATGRAVDIALAASSYFEAVGNFWPTTTIQGDMYRINGTDLRSYASTGQQGNAKAYIRDHVHGERRLGISELNIWVTHPGVSVLRIDRGKNLVITGTPSADITVFEPLNWRGVEFTVHFKASATLKHGTGFFWLAKGADATVPAGYVLRFVIDMDGIVREVGDTTARF